MHPSNAWDMILVTDNGIIICLIDLQFLNAKDWISFKSDGSFIVFNDEQSSNAWDKILVTEDGIINCFKDLHP